MPTRKILQDIHDELVLAQSKHPDMISLHEGYAVILEELDEFWNEVKGHHQERRLRCRKELIQVAAACVRTILTVIDN